MLFLQCMYERYLLRVIQYLLLDELNPSGHNKMGSHQSNDILEINYQRLDYFLLEPYFELFWENKKIWDVSIILFEEFLKTKKMQIPSGINRYFDH